MKKQITEEIQKELTETLEKLIIKKISEDEIIVKSQSGSSITVKLNYDFEKYGIKPGDFMIPYKGSGIDVGMCVGISEIEDFVYLWFIHKGNKGISHSLEGSKKSLGDMGCKIISKEEL